MKFWKVIINLIIICLVNVNSRAQLQKMNLDAGTRFTEIPDISWPSNVGDAEVCLWNDDKVGTVTLTIDDNNVDQHDWWLSMQENYPSLKFTWFIVYGTGAFAVDWRDFQGLIDAGNEVQANDYCMSMNHGSINDATDQEYHDHFVTLNSLMDNNLSKPITTMSFPNGVDKNELVRDLYIGMRGAVAIPNNANDINYLSVQSISGSDNLNHINTVIDPEAKVSNQGYYRGWTCAHYREVEDLETLETYLSYLHSKSDVIWIGTFSDVVKYGQERDSHTLTVTEVDPLSVKFTLSDEMNDNYFDFPLTVKVKIPNDWNGVTAAQNGEFVEAKIVENDGDKYALVKAVPDKGEVVVMSTGVYYCSPTGSMSNDGTSPEAPWADLETVLSEKTFLDGSVIYLMSGDHGEPVVSESNSYMVTITRYANDNPVIHNIYFNKAEYWTLKDVKICADGDEVPNKDLPLTHPVYPLGENSLVNSNASRNITIENCEISSIDDISGWTSEDDWNYSAWNGIYFLNGVNIIMHSNKISNVNFGITTSASGSIIESNEIQNFNGDGLRPDCDNAVVINNIVKDSYDTNGNHCDLLQIYKGGGVTGSVISGNIFIGCTNPNRDFIGNAQGIALFDGMYTNFVIENNLVLTDHYHGISVYGAKNCKIINNTVIDNINNNVGPLWITISDAKGTESSGNIVKNNLCTSITVSSKYATLSNNTVVKWANYNDYFVDFENFDYTLAANSPAIDAGTNVDAPASDILGNIRPSGSKVDVGAYEYQQSQNQSIQSAYLSQNIPGIVEFEYYDNGGQNISFYDDLEKNGDSSYRPGDMIDCEVTTDTDGGYNVGWVNSGEWLEYTIDNIMSGIYTINVRAALGSSVAGELIFKLGDGTEDNDLDTIATIAIQPTGSDDTWQTFSVADVYLQAATNKVIRVEAFGDGFKLNKMEFVAGLIDVTGVTMEPENLTIFKGQAYELSGIITPDSASIHDVTWSSSDPSIATIDENGVIKGVAEGTTQITVTTVNGGYTSNCSIMVMAAPTNLALNKPVTVDSEYSDELSASKAVDGAKTLGEDRWVSANVDYPHWVTVGLQDISLVSQVKFWTGYSDEYNDALADYQIQYWSGTAWVDIVMVTGNTSSVVVETFTAVAATKFRLYATQGTRDSYMRLYEIEIYGNVVDEEIGKVTDISLDKESLTLEAGSTSELVPEISPDYALDKTVTWSSSNEAVATVDENGKVTAKAAGKVTITVISKDGNYTASTEVTVNILSGIATELQAKAIKVYPNPLNTDFIHISISGYKEDIPIIISITNLNGKLIVERKATAAELLSGSIKLYRGEMLDGIYLLKVSNNKEFKVAKLIIE